MSARARAARGRRIYPKTLGEWLIIPVTFPIWILSKILNPKDSWTYFFDHEEVKEDEKP